ncbi:MAG: hypothetical protein KGZ82_10965 [Bacteroidales bacterium]|nr:hypothetical protein [Bacteroidales bacterium]
MQSLKQYSGLFTVITLSFILLCSKSFGQNEFKLSDYQNPDYTYHALDLGFGLQSDNIINQTVDRQSVKQSSNQGAASFNASPTYHVAKNNVHYQGSTMLSMNLSGAWSRFTSENDQGINSRTKNRSGSYGVNLGYYSTNRYYNSKNQFIELIPMVHAGFNYFGQKFDNKPVTYPERDWNRSRSGQFDLAMALMLGKGRIEAVQDARLAVYILEDLHKSGDLSKQADGDDILALAYKITSVKNKRYFDARLRKIAEINAIDSLIASRGLKNTSGASYYTLLNDNWDHANGPLRSAGQRFSFGLVPQFSGSYYTDTYHYYDTVSGIPLNQHYSNENKYQTGAWGLDLKATYQCEKPVSLSWQHSGMASLAYGLYHSSNQIHIYEKNVLITEQENIDNTPNAYGIISHRLGYYPNSRTSLSLNASLAYSRYWGDSQYNQNAKIKNGRQYVDGVLQFNCRYYVSPQLRFSIDYLADYRYIRQVEYGSQGSNDIINSSNNFLSQLIASLTYSIF